MVKFSKDITFPYDLKGRTAPMFVHAVAYEVAGAVYLEKDGREINLNSLLGVLSLNIKKGDKVTVSAYDESNLNSLLELLQKEEL